MTSTSRIRTLAVSLATAATVLLMAGCSGSTPAPTAGPSLPVGIVQTDSASPSDSPTPEDTATALPPPPPSPAPKPSPAPRKTSPKPKPPTHKPSPAPAQTIHGVHPGAFCSQHGSYGLTVDGTLMRCTTTATDSRYRWRKA